MFTCTMHMHTTFAHMDAAPSGERCKSGDGLLVDKTL